MGLNRVFLWGCKMNDTMAGIVEFILFKIFLPFWLLMLAILTLQVTVGGVYVVYDLFAHKHRYYNLDTCLQYNPAAK